MSSKPKRNTPEKGVSAGTPATSSEAPAKDKKTFRQVVRIMAGKVMLHQPGGLSRFWHQGEIVLSPWPALLEEAKLDTEHRVFQIIDQEV